VTAVVLRDTIQGTPYGKDILHLLQFSKLSAVFKKAI